MNILSDDQYRALAFIAACNRSSYYPTAQQVILWLNNPKPVPAVYRTVEREVLPSFHSQIDSAASRMMSTILNDAIRPLTKNYLANPMGAFPRTVTGQQLVTPAETPIEHLLRLTWLETVSAPGKSGLRLTDLGAALLRDYQTADDTDEGVSVVVLGREDPLAYPILVGQIAAAGPGLLVDPYLKLPDLHMIVVSTQLTRLLVSGKPANSAVVSSMQAYLDSPSLGRRVEVRASTELHDRVVVADDGDLLTLGTSLNGVGRTTTVMTPIPSPAREALRDDYERVWTNASLVGPPPEQLEQEGDSSEEDADQEEQEPLGNNS